MSGRRSLPKDLREWASQARSQGWTVEVARGGHIRFNPPQGEGRPIQVSATPSDRRSRLNERARLRRHGLEV